ncbi:hypothetical protein T484DRAFT_1767320 [Baffinella frigidus]|nr:hypothetical protein T484DRAFT_1767320 [Cryptophyta sp. CCMP2293]
MLATLRLLQCASLAQRFRKSHISYEDATWKRAFVAETALLSLLRPASAVLLACSPDACGSGGGGSGGSGGGSGGVPTLDVKASRAALRLAEEELCSWMEARGMRDMLHGGRGDAWYLGTNFRVSAHPCSYHLPLHRGYARLLLESMLLLPPDVHATTLLDQAAVPKGFSRAVLEHLIRVAALSAQVGAGVWVRNGNAMPSQDFNYSLERFAHDGRDLDVLLMQFNTATLPDPAALVPLLIERFELCELFRDDASPREPGPRDPTLPQQMQVAEEMLRLLITLLTANDFTAPYTVAERTRHFLVHCLATQARTHSQLLDWVRHAPLAPGAEPVTPRDIDEILHTIAQRSGAQGEYELCPEAWPEAWSEVAP